MPHILSTSGGLYKGVMKGDTIAGSMLGILFTFWGMGFLIFRKKGSFFLPRVMWTKIGVQHIVYVHPQGSHGCSLGLGGYCVGFTG